MGERLEACVVSYADDFVILSRHQAGKALVWTRQVMTRLGLDLNEAKTSIRRAREERFDFLGYTLGRITFARTAIGIWVRVRPGRASPV